MENGEGGKKAGDLEDQRVSGQYGGARCDWSRRAKDPPPGHQSTVLNRAAKACHQLHTISSEFQLNAQGPPIPPFPNSASSPAAQTLRTGLACALTRVPCTLVAPRGAGYFHQRASTVPTCFIDGVHVRHGRSTVRARKAGILTRASLNTAVSGSEMATCSPVRSSVRDDSVKSRRRMTQTPSNQFSLNRTLPSHASALSGQEWVSIRPRSLHAQAWTLAKKLNAIMMTTRNRRRWPEAPFLLREV